MGAGPSKKDRLDEFTCQKAGLKDDDMTDSNAQCSSCDGGSISQAEVMNTLQDFWKQALKLTQKKPNQVLLATFTCAHKASDSDSTCPDLYFRLIPDGENSYTIERLERPIVHKPDIPPELKAVWAKYHNLLATPTYPVCHRYSTMQMFELVLLKQLEKGYTLHSMREEE